MRGVKRGRESAYGYGPFYRIPTAPMRPNIYTPKAYGRWERRDTDWRAQYAQLSPLIMPSTILTDGVWRGKRADEALANREFADWLLHYPHTLSGEARGLLYLLLRMRVASAERRNLARKRWRQVLWTTRLRNALYAAAERGARRRGAYVAPPVDEFLTAILSGVGDTKYVAVIAGAPGTDDGRDV